MIRPIKSINKILPILLKSFLVTYPKRAVAPKVPAVIPKVVAMDSCVYIRKIADSVTPVTAE